MLTANKIRDGEAEAFEILIDTFKDKVFNYCFKITRNYHVAEEPSQEIFIKV